MPALLAATLTELTQAGEVCAQGPAKGPTGKVGTRSQSRTEEHHREG